MRLLDWFKKTSEYDQLRKSVGMSPAREDDYCEYVAWVVVLDLLSPEVANECEHVPPEERGLFMMTYATYLSWLAMRGVESSFPTNYWRLITPLLQRESSKQSWHQPEVMNQLFDSMVKRPPTGEIKGRYFNASLGPWLSAVMATNLAGYTLSCSGDIKFNLYVAIISGNILKTISKIGPQIS